MSILLTNYELDYIHSNEFQHPKTRPEKRRAENFKQKWIKRASKDRVFQQELQEALKRKKEVDLVSFCESCYCMTKTINGKCASCKAKKEQK